MKKGRSTLVLLAAVLLAGAFILLQEYWRVASQPRRILRTHLFDIDPASLVSLRFESTNAVVECEKKNGIWMTGAEGGGLGRADLVLLSRSVGGLNALEKGAVITPENMKARGLDIAEYGFAKPQARIAVTDNRGTRSWLVGRATPLGNMLYAKPSESDSVYTVPDSLLDFIPTQPNQFRDRSLFFGNVPGVRRIEIRGPGGFIQILREPPAGWRIQQPVAGAADNKAVEEYLKKLYKLRVDHFVADNVSDFVAYGLQGDARQISLGGIDGTSRLLVVGDSIPDTPGFVYARRGDDASVFALSTNVLALLDVKVDALRDVRVLQLPVSAVSSVSIRRGSDQLVLERAPSGAWSVVRPVEWKADASAVARLLKLWDMAMVVRFTDDLPAVEPDWVLEFGSREMGKTNRIEVLPDFGRKDGLFVVRNGESTLCQINLPQIPDSILDPLQYKDRRVWNIGRGEIDRLVLKRRGQPDLVAERTGPGFASPAAQKLAGRLAALSAREYVAYNPPSLAPYGLDDPALSLQVGLSGTNSLGRILLLGREGADGFYAMVKGRDVVFLLDKPLVESLPSSLERAEPPKNDG